MHPYALHFIQFARKLMEKTTQIVCWSAQLALCASSNHAYPLRQFMNSIRNLTESINDATKLTIECSYIAAKVMHHMYLRHEQCRDAIVSTAIHVVLMCDRPDLQELFVSLVSMLTVDCACADSYLFHHMRVHLIRLANTIMKTSSKDSKIALKFLHLLERVILSLAQYPSVILQLLYLDLSTVTKNQINYSKEGLSSTEIDVIIAKANNVEVCCADVINTITKQGRSDEAIGVVRLFGTIALTAFDLLGTKIIAILTKKRANAISNELRIMTSAVIFDVVSIYPDALWDTLMTTLKEDLIAKSAHIQSFTITAFCRILNVSLYQSISIDLHRYALVEVLSAILTQHKVKQKLDSHIVQHHDVDDFHCILNESNESQLIHYPLFVPSIQNILDDVRHYYGYIEYKAYVSNIINKMVQKTYELVVLRVHEENVDAMYNIRYVTLLLQQYFNILSLYFPSDILHELELSSNTGAVTNTSQLYCSLAHESFESEFDIALLHEVFHTISSLDIAAAFTTGINYRYGLKLT